MGEPYTNGKNYEPLLKLIANKEIKINKISVVFSENKIIIDGRIVKNVLISSDGIFFTGEHYTSRDKARQIIQTRYFSPGKDGFAYFLEANIGITDKDFLKQLTGADEADAMIKINTEAIALERVWIKTERKFPYLKIAVEEGISMDELSSLPEHHKL